jgi:hypothetical protein
MAPIWIAIDEKLAKPASANATTTTVTDHEIARAAQTLDGHRVPAEAVTWWRWRNPTVEVEIVPILTLVPCRPPCWSVTRASNAP